MDMQRAWDTSVITAWREDGTIWNAIFKWEELTGKRFSDHLQELRRAPRSGLPWKMRVRVFVAEYLPKISNRLWDQSPARDEPLINKLQTSSYTTVERPTHANDDFLQELKQEQRAIKKSLAIYTLENENYHKRNHATDWNVTKASRRHTRAVR